MIVVVCHPPTILISLIFVTRLFDTRIQHLPILTAFKRRAGGGGQFSEVVELVLQPLAFYLSRILLSAPAEVHYLWEKGDAASPVRISQS